MCFFLRLLQQFDEGFTGVYSKRREGVEQPVNEGFEEYYAWLIWVDKLCENTGERWDDIYKWTALEFMNKIAYFTAKQNHIEWQTKQQMRSLKH